MSTASNSSNKSPFKIYFNIASAFRNLSLKFKSNIFLSASIVAFLSIKQYNITIAIVKISEMYKDILTLKTHKFKESIVIMIRVFEDDNFQTIFQIKLPFDEYAMMKNCTDITNPPRN